MYSRDVYEFIDELLDLIVKQEKEIRRLEETISRINQYIETYEDYIKGE